jgi:hypothetical protein
MELELDSIRGWMDHDAGGGGDVLQIEFVLSLREKRVNRMARLHTSLA